MIYITPYFAISYRAAFRLLFGIVVWIAAYARVYKLVEKRREKARKKPPRSAMSAVTWGLSLGMLAVWGLSMACLTLVFAQQLYNGLYQEAADFADYVDSIGLRDFYDADYPRYGSQYERPDLVDYAMLGAIRNTQRYVLSLSNPPEGKLWLTRDVSVPMETAVLFYDGDGKLLHKNSDFLYFYYATQEEWDAGREEQAGHCGWIDLGEGGDDDPWLPFRSRSSGHISLYDYRALRITGTMKGTEIEPVSVEYLSDDALSRALEERGPTEQGIDEDGAEYVSYDYLLSDLDRAGLLEWETLFDHPGGAEEGLVTVYAYYLSLNLYDKQPLAYYGAGAWEDWESLAALAESMDFPAWEGMDGGFRGMSEYGLGRIIHFDGRTYRNWVGYDFGADEAYPPVEAYMIVAVACAPLQSAVVALRSVYALTALVAAAVVLLLRRRLRDRLIGPLADINAGMAENWRFVYTPDNKPRQWRETEELYSHYQDEIDHRRFDKNEISRLNTALDYAKKAEQNRRQMTSAIAHELKTPLAVVHSYAEGLKEHIAEEKRETYLDTILAETERMDGMVLEMLDLSRLEAGKVKLSRDEFSLSALAKSTFDKLAPPAEEKRLEVVFELDGNCRIAADEARIGQVIENFASNALRYAPEGGKVLVKTRSGGGETRFSVENTTERPFTAEELSKVWDTFYRTDKARGGKGTGLGLAIAKNIIGLHGGTCTVRNTDTGVEFGFVI